MCPPLLRGTRTKMVFTCRILLIISLLASSSNLLLPVGSEYLSTMGLCDTVNLFGPEQEQSYLPSDLLVPFSYFINSWSDWSVSSGHSQLSVICGWASSVSNENVVVSKQSQPWEMPEMLLVVCAEVSDSEVRPSVAGQSQVALLALSSVGAGNATKIIGLSLLPALPGVLVCSIFVELKK